MIAKVVWLSRLIFHNLLRDTCKSDGAAAQCLPIHSQKWLCRCLLFCWHSPRVFTCFVLFWGFFWEEGSFFIHLFVFIFCGFPFARESNRSKVSLDHKKEEPLSLFNPLCEYILENTAFKFPKGIISKRQRQRGLWGELKLQVEWSLLKLSNSFILCL